MTCIILFLYFTRVWLFSFYMEANLFLNASYTSTIAILMLNSCICANNKAFINEFMISTSVYIIVYFITHRKIKQCCFVNFAY